jgi:hypothetical protein
MALELKLVVEPPVVHRPEELVARGTYTNRAAEPFRFSVASVASASLALAVRRAGGAIVPMAPPPVPYPEERSGDTIVLAPGGAHSVEFRNFLPQRLARGDYEACLRYRHRGSDLQSRWEPFTLV